MVTLILCLKVFFSRILDVSLGTIRMILTVKEKTLIASIVGFIEIFIWFLVVREALSSDVVGIFPALAYASGYACGTYIGGLVSKKFIKSKMTVEIVTTARNDKVAAQLRENGFAVSELNVNRSEFGDEKYMLFCEIESSFLRELRNIVEKNDPNAFIMVQETKQIFHGYLKK